MSVFAAGATAVAAVTVGLLLSPIPTKLGFYRWWATRDPSNPRGIGLFPAWNYGIEWGYTFEELNASDLTGQTAIVTGANSGIGYEIALALARLGASVILACRNPQKCLQAAERIQTDSRCKGKVTPMTVDVSSLKSVKEFAQNFLKENDKLDMLFLNAGIGSQHTKHDKTFPLSEDGVELVFATNVLGHHLLYKMLEPALLKSVMARVVLTSSLASFGTYDYRVATDLDTLNGVEVSRDNSRLVYGQSKLAQILWAKRLTRKLGPKSCVYSNAANPGAVATAIFDKVPALPKLAQLVLNVLRNRAMWKPEEGALTLLYLGVATKELKEKNIRGKYFHPQSVEVINPLSLDEALQDKLWAFCDDLVKDFI